MTPPPKAPEAARETARNRVVKPQLEAILSEMNAISDEELTGLICVAMERRPWLLPSVLGNNGDA